MWGLEAVALREHCALDAEAARLLQAAIQKFCLSALAAATASFASAAQLRI